VELPKKESGVTKKGKWSYQKRKVENQMSFHNFSKVRILKKDEKNQ
jgi:hypothetical protein